MHEAANRTATADGDHQGPGAADPRPLGEHVEQYRQAWDERDEWAARAAALRALDDGLRPESVLLDMIGAARHRIGREWTAARFTVVREVASLWEARHIPSAVLTAVLDVLGARLRDHPRAAATPTEGLDARAGDGR